jgi:diguanylate cyclase (GGDEF)-like protein/PAS domain S-box-containing protein
MSEQNLLFATLLLIAALATTIIAVIVWQRRHNPSAHVLLWLTMAMIWWDMTYAFHWMGLFQPTPFFWLDATYLGVVMVPTLFLIFIIYFTNQGRWLKKWYSWLLLVEPIVVFVGLWTDPLHNLFFSGLRQPGASTILNGGPLYWINIIYSFLLMLLAYIVLLHTFRRETKLYRLQAITILVGATFPWIFVIIGVAGVSPLKNLDLTPFGFTITSIAFTIGLLRYRLLDIIPLARDLLVETLRDGVMVLDASNRVVDINPSIANILKLPIEKIIGNSMASACVHWKHLDELYRLSEEGLYETMLRIDNKEHYFEVSFSVIHSERVSFIGRLIEIRDITALKTSEVKLRKANQLLTAQLSEIEKLQSQLEEMAIRDSLTGLFNRRTLGDFLDREIAQAARANNSLAVVLIDIDHFKRINDSYGHLAGDLVLSQLGEQITENVRMGDFACRYGGEEFVIVMPDIGIGDAVHRIDQLREMVFNMKFEYKNQDMNITLSAGVSAFPNNGQTTDTLLFAADQALYAAKNAGRNRVVTHDDIIIF